MFSWGAMLGIENDYFFHHFHTFLLILLNHFNSFCIPYGPLSFPFEYVCSIFHEVIRFVSSLVNRDKHPCLGLINASFKDCL